MSRFLLLVAILSGCFTIKKTKQAFNNGNFNEIRKYEIKEFTIELAREKCAFDCFSFCSDGYEQVFRLYPLFIKLKKDNFLASYDTVYMFPPDNLIKQLRNENIEIMDVWEMDTMFTGTLNNIITYSNDEFYKKVKRYYKRNNILKSDSCNFSYQVYKMNFIAIYGGKRQIILPDFNKKSNSLIRDHRSEVYYIISIKSIESIK